MEAIFEKAWNDTGLREMLTRIAGAILYAKHSAYVDDIVQESFIEFYIRLCDTSKPAFKPLYPKSYLCNITKNKSINLLKKKESRVTSYCGKEDLHRVDIKEYDILNRIIVFEGKKYTVDELFEKLIAALPETQKNSVTLQIYGLSIAEIARLEKTSVSTITGRIYYAKQNMRKIVHGTRRFKKQHPA